MENERKTRVELSFDPYEEGTTNPLDCSSSLQSPLETYLREINETKLLNAQEEKELAQQIAQGDVRARDRMVRANLRLVVNIARGYTGKGLGLQDLIEEGNLGLLRAVEGYDPEVGTRFSTYESYWIKQSIKRALANQSKTIRPRTWSNSFLNGDEPPRDSRKIWAEPQHRKKLLAFWDFPKRSFRSSKRRSRFTTRRPKLTRLKRAGHLAKW